MKRTGVPELLQASPDKTPAFRRHIPLLADLPGAVVQHHAHHLLAA
jgi:hypothetical protein